MLNRKYLFNLKLTLILLGLSNALYVTFVVVMIKEVEQIFLVNAIKFTVLDQTKIRTRCGYHELTPYSIILQILLYNVVAFVVVVAVENITQLFLGMPGKFEYFPIM